MENYKTVKVRFLTEETIKKSRFLAVIDTVADYDEAIKILAELRREHPFATHICYGAVLDSLGNVMRFSDDGEPQGTAGMPILDVLRKNDFRHTIIAVIRYFGGVKLGAGGLVRAYSSLAAKAVRQAEVIIISPKKTMEITMDYPTYSKIERYLKKEGIALIKTLFSDNINLTLEIDCGIYEEFLNRLKNEQNITIKEG